MTARLTPRRAATRRNIAILFRRNGASCLAEMPRQPNASFSRFAAETLSSTFVITRTQARPTCEMSRIWELIHIHTNLGQQTPSCNSFDTGNRTEMSDLLFKGVHAFRNFGLQSFDLALDKLQMINKFFQQKTMMR